MVPRLVADIGGTNARFALLDDGGQRYGLQVKACAGYDSLAAVIDDYLSTHAGDRPRHAILAVACPVSDDQFELTNLPWRVSIGETRAALGLQSLRAINDFTALALGLPGLQESQLNQIGAGSRVDRMPMALIGPGTGLGVSGLIPTTQGWLPLASEGGHVSYGAVNSREQLVLTRLAQRYKHISAERLLSGPGLVNIHAALATLEEFDNGCRQSPEPELIVARASDASCPLCVETLDMFCAMLGTVAGNLALTLGAQGGVYIGGGIVPNLGAVFQRSTFRQRFEQHGRLTAYLETIPSYVIEQRFAALIGVARAFDPFYAKLGISSVAP